MHFYSLSYTYELPSTFDIPTLDPTAYHDWTNLEVFKANLPVGSPQNVRGVGQLG